jgi:hypothetical protein
VCVCVCVCVNRLEHELGSPRSLSKKEYRYENTVLQRSKDDIYIYEYIYVYSYIERLYIYVT